MNQSEIEVVMLDVDRIKVLIHRDRNREEYERMRDSIKEHGVKIPIQVRDIRHWPDKDRERPQGGLYWWELVWGEGRLEAVTELGRKKIPGTITEAPEVEIVGRFLSENMIRVPLPWAEKAKLMKAEFDSGMSTKDVAAMFFVSEAHVEKCRRILSKTAVGLGEEIAAMAMNDAEVLTTLPQDEQSIVVEVLKETAGIEGNVQAAVARAKAVKAETGTLSALSLKKSVQRVDEELADVRDRLKPIRLHWSLGPCNLKTLLENPKFKSALKKAGVATAKFEKLTA